MPLVSFAQQASLNSSFTAQKSAATKAKLCTGYGHLPMQFEPNMGQTDSRVKFITHANGGTLFLTDTEAVLTIPQKSSAQKSFYQA